MRKKTFTKQVLLLLLIIIGGSSMKAQNDSTYIYQSFFGNDSTTINSYGSIVDADQNYTFTIRNKDTITIDNKLYYLVEPGQIQSNPDYNTSNYAEETIYFREDSEYGKLYMYVNNDNIDKELLLCDMSLNVGDTFTFPSIYDVPEYIQEHYVATVQNIRYEDGNKIIEFDGIWLDAFSWDNIIFVEGVFPIIIPNYYDSDFSELTCQYKDGNLTYETSNPYLLSEMENCLIRTYLNTPEIETDGNLTIHPTVLLHSETLSIKSDSGIKGVKMIDMLGRNVNVSINLTDEFSCEMSLDQRCKSGIYLIIVENEKGVCYEKVILRD